MSRLLEHDPAEVGPFRLIGRLGAGGMGVVYAGVSDSGQRVAVKVVHPELAHDPEFRARFSREIALLGRIDGACTVTVLDADPEADRPWFATEYVPGPTLKAHVMDAGPLAGDELYGVASGLAEALMSMHAAGVIHRDLKPANVILSPSGPKVVDLGIARAMDETGVTRTGVLVGSPGWLSPEHYRGGELGPATDVHAWGLAVAFAATGRLPFGTGRPEVLAVRVLRDEVDLTGLEPGLRPAVVAALAKAPEERPSASEVLTAVTEAWRRRTDVDVGDVAGVGAATALIERTWLMPDPEDSGWAVAPDAGAGPGERPWRRTPVLAALVVTALAGAALAAALLSPGGTAPHRGAGKDAASATSSPSPSDSAEPLRGRRVSLGGGVSAVVPPGWSAAGGREPIGDYLCIQAPGGSGHDCMNHGVLLENWTGTDDEPDLDAPDAWAGDADESALPQCFDPRRGYATGITSSYVSDTGLRKLGDQQAIFHEYHVACGPGVSFNPRIWWHPKTRLMMVVVALPERYRTMVDRIAASVRFG